MPAVKFIAVAFAFVALLFMFATDIPLSRLGYSFCALRCSSAVSLSNGTHYALYDSDGNGTLALYQSHDRLGLFWMRIDEARILPIWEIFEPADIVISPDEAMMFIRRNSDRSRTGDTTGAFWSDLVDVSGDVPRLLIGGGSMCCMQEDYPRLRANDLEIEMIAAKTLRP
jgi:hypothetical protein